MDCCTDAAVLVGGLSVPDPAPLPQEAARGRAAPRGDVSAEAAMLRSLISLDAAISRWARAQRRRDMIRRVWAGVADHFRERATEWFAAAILLQLGRTLYFPPPAFPTSESWRVMASQMPEEVWGLIFLGIGALRFAALAINGTFSAFRFSPHVRCATAFLACGLWFQVVMSIYQSSPDGTGFGVYRLILGLELYNLWRSARDTGAGLKRLRRND